MREIKFRAWDKERSEMYEVDALHFCRKLIEVDNETDHQTTSIEPYELMQYTGLKDKNDREIYEGDILGWDGGREGISKLPSDYIIEVLKSNHLAIELEEHTNAYMFHYDTSGYNFPCFLEAAEVIGNIYENPELLERK